MTRLPQAKRTWYSRPGRQDRETLDPNRCDTDGVNAQPKAKSSKSSEEAWSPTMGDLLVLGGAIVLTAGGLLRKVGFSVTIAPRG